MTLKGIDMDRQFVILQCDTCGKIASMQIDSLIGHD